MWKLDKCNFHHSFNFLGCNYIQFQEANHASFTLCDVFPLISDALGSDTSASNTDTLNKRSVMGHDRGGGGGCSQALFLLLPLLQGSVAAFLLHSEGPFECPGWVEEIKIFWTELLTLFEMIRITKTFQKKHENFSKEDQFMLEGMVSLRILTTVRCFTIAPTEDLTTRLVQQALCLTSGYSYATSRTRSSFIFVDS